jgi:maleate isomerase
LAVRNALSAEVTYIMMGMSAETFWGGLEGNIAFEKSIRDQIGDIGLTTGAEAVRTALEAFGAKRISVITPYPPVGDANVRRYFSDIGFDVKHVLGLNCASATSIAHTSQSDVANAVRAVDGDDVDAIVQCGTNLSCADLFPALEVYLDKPLLPINVACVWHALRACGINDKISGHGRLLEVF